MRGTLWKSGHQDQSGPVYNEFTKSHTLEKFGKDT